MYRKYKQNLVNFMTIKNENEIANLNKKHAYIFMIKNIYLHYDMLL